MAHTQPAVNIPSKKNPMIGLQSYILLHKPPRISDIKKPTQVEVHNVHEIKSPKNLEYFLMNCLEDSKIVPHTKIDVIP